MSLAAITRSRVNINTVIACNKTTTITRRPALQVDYIVPCCVSTSPDPREQVTEYDIKTTTIRYGSQEERDADYIVYNRILDRTPALSGNNTQF